MPASSNAHFRAFLLLLLVAACRVKAVSRDASGHCPVVADPPRTDASSAPEAAPPSDVVVQTVPEEVLTVDDSLAVRTACATQVQHARERIATVFRSRYNDWMRAGDLRSFTRCYPSRRGAWLLLLESLRWNSSPSQSDDGSAETGTLRGTYNVGYLRSDGTLVRMWSTPRRISAVQLASQSVHALGSSDLDGDGVAEFFFAPTSTGHESNENDRGRPVEIATVRDGSVLPYAPLGTLRAHSIEDYDSDGRLDLRIESEFELESNECGGLHPAMYRGPALLVHARSDGTFSNNDRVATAALRDACPTAPTRIVAEATFQTQLSVGHEVAFDPAETVQRIACARYWGQAPTELLRRIRAEYPRGTSVCLSLAQLTRLAQVTTASSMRLQ